MVQSHSLNATELLLNDQHANHTSYLVNTTTPTICQAQAQPCVNNNGLGAYSLFCPLPRALVLPRIASTIPLATLSQR